MTNAEQITALLATDSLEDLEAGLENRLGYMADVVHGADWYVSSHVYLIGSGATREAALAAAIVYLDSLTASEPDDGSALEHEYFLRSDR
jgi:hypothetical protein